LGRKATALILGALIACLGIFAFSTSQAKAAPFSMDLTNGQLNLGFAFKGAVILPSPDRIPATNPTANLPDLWAARADTPTGACLGTSTCPVNPNKATVSGDLTGNAVTVTGSPDNGAANSFGLPNGFRFPVMVVPNPLDGTPVPVTIASTGNLTGTFDSSTGALTLNGPIEARVLTGINSNPLGSYCALPLEGLSLSTSSNADFPGVPFESGLSGSGALTGLYNITQDAVSVGGADCAIVNQVSRGAGSVWVSNNIAEPPVCPEGESGIPPNCIPDNCPTGQIGTPPNCVPAKAKISRVAVSGPSKIKVRRSSAFKVKITNSGNISATGVRLRVSGRGITVNSNVGTVGAGATRTVTVRVRPQRTGKATATFKVTSSNAGTRSAKRTVRVVR
jgi:hypothetical protein